MKYRVQAADYLGLTSRAFSGRKPSWGKWRTIASEETEEAGRAKFRELSRRGLRRFRLLHGTKELDKN